MASESNPTDIAETLGVAGWTGLIPARKPRARNELRWANDPSGENSMRQRLDAAGGDVRGHP